VTDTAQQFASLVKQAQPVMENLTDATKQAEIAASSLNQAIVETSPEVLATTQHLNSLAAHGDKVAADAQAVSDHYTDKIIHPAHTVLSKVTSFGKLALLGLRAFLAWP
jgi:ABC-type transporter Mla subunit MlaD